MNWKVLEQNKQLDSIVEESKIHPIVIFKHSTRCPVSSMALSRFESDWSDDKAGEITPYFLDLIANRQISNEVASRFGVTHQSPQVLVIKDGLSVYDASHNSIDFTDILSFNE